MAKSTIERVHNYRKRLKDDPVKYEAYKLKDKKRKQQARKKAKRIPVCTSDAARKRKLNRERVRRFRLFHKPHYQGFKCYTVRFIATFHTVGYSKAVNRLQFVRGVKKYIINE